MITVELVRWHPGLNTVALILAVRSHSTFSLSAAKREVERFLDGENVVLTFLTEEKRNAFLNEVENLDIEVTYDLDPK